MPNLKHKDILGNAVCKCRDRQGPEDGGQEVALPTLSLFSRAEASLPPPRSAGPAMGDTCEMSRGSARALSCHLTHGLWSASGHVPVSSTIHTLMCHSPGRVLQGFCLCFLFLFRTLLPSFLQSDTIADNSHNRLAKNHHMAAKL